MKKFLLLTMFSFSAAYLSAQNCKDCRYISPVFDSVTVTTLHFGQGMTIENNMQQLYMDVYQPYGDTLEARPVLIFAFGGGFVQGSREDWYVKEVCNQFAKAGYVCVAPDYRLGINYAEIVLIQHMRIFFRPMQDLRGCIQYLKADFAEMGNNFKIDTNRIIVGGASSGAITALMTQYCDKESEMAQMGNISALDALGGFYSSTGFFPNYTWNGVAVINMAGALVDANWIEPGDVPVISAHGNQDDIVPYGYGGFGGLTFGFFDLQGSHVIDSIAKLKNVCSYLYTMEGWGHPEEAMGIDYIKSIVYRMALRAHAVINNRSFCCPLDVDIEGDTLHVWTDQPLAETTLAAGIINDNGNATWQWCAIPCFPFTDNGDEITLIPDTNLSYITLIVYEDGCEASDLYIVTDTSVVPQSVYEQLNRIDFSVYPQPANSQLNISADLAEFTRQPIVVEIFNIKGQQIFAQQFSANKNFRASIETDEILSGNYLLRIKSGNQILGAKNFLITR